MSCYFLCFMWDKMLTIYGDCDEDNDDNRVALENKFE